MIKEGYRGILYRFFLGLIMITIAISTVSSIEIKLEHSIGEPEVPLLPVASSGYRPTAGIPIIAWLDSSTILYDRSPFVWKVNMNNLSFVPEVEICQELNIDGFGIEPLSKHNGVILFHGTVWEADFYLYVNGEHERLLVDQSRKLRANPTTQEHRYPDRQSMPDNWRYTLYGGYTIEPGPTRDFDLMDLALYHPTGKLLELLPKEFYRFMNFASYTMVAITQDLFRIAIIGQKVQRSACSSIERGWDLYILRVIYDGLVDSKTGIFSAPRGENPIGILLPDTPVKVIAADQFEILSDGRSDYWYQITTKDQSGWIYGGDLLIENSSWEERLALRDQPMTVKELIESIKNE